jgi:hypothetical protein
MTLLAAADQGGITGFLPDLVHVHRTVYRRARAA